jgi:bacterioferritin (cytochrome b1)
MADQEEIMTPDRLSENDLWLLNYYRASEINGALFFGRIARVVRGPLQVDVTHHFADEATHANYWTECLRDLGHNPSRQVRGYQDQYFDAAGVPASLMEVLAITLVFERRTMNQYGSHLRSAPHPTVRQTLERIMVDERWHVKYVRDALQEMSARYGEEQVNQTLDRYTAADQEVYAQTIAEHGERMLLRARPLSEEPAVSR